MTDPNAFLHELRHQLVRLEGIIQALDVIDCDNCAATPSGNATSVLIGLARELSSDLSSKVDRFTTDAGNARATGRPAPADGLVHVPIIGAAVD